MARAQAAQPFSVALRDMYGSLGLTESQGECSIVYNGTQITLPDLGHSVDIQAGLARFQQFSVLGMCLLLHTSAVPECNAAQQSGRTFLSQALSQHRIRAPDATRAAGPMMPSNMLDKSRIDGLRCVRCMPHLRTYTPAASCLQHMSLMHRRHRQQLHHGHRVRSLHSRPERSAAPQ